ncbi:MAG: terminase [Prevotellaceae bacterium]|jgi:hypothetical protein|nr:terminase [Prevotellaceae bacterium]
MHKPDYSDYLAHFTKNEEPFCNDEANPILSHTKGTKSAFERLKSILKDKKIIASTMPWNKKNCVCFTECPWTSLIAHAERYSSFAIGFNKEFIFKNNGSPVFYVRADFFNKQKWDDFMYHFVTPFWPSYRPLKKKRDNKQIKISKTVDFTHEREWRVAEDLIFDYCDVEFIIVEKYENIEQLDANIVNAIGKEKFLVMDSYKFIEELWSVHKIDKRLQTK